VLEQIDLVKMYGPMPFSLDFFTECTNFAPLIRYGNVATVRHQLSYAVQLFSTVIIVAGEINL
jgi:hypothetical protein